MDKNYELIIYLLSQHYRELDLENMDYWDLIELFYEHYGIDDEDFDTLITELLPLCNMAKSHFTDDYYQGFSDSERCLWLRNKKVK